MLERHDIEALSKKNSTSENHEIPELDLTMDNSVENEALGSAFDEVSPFVMEEPPFISQTPAEAYGRHVEAKLKQRSTAPLSKDEYHKRLKELNNNAENKHVVLFFGKPASGKTWVIGSILHYMKNYLEGVVYLDTNKTTVSEDTLFYQLQNCFNGIEGTDSITRTDTHQYFEFHISFTPKDSSKPAFEVSFIDASGEHSDQAFLRENRSDSGQLPNYLTVFLDSEVQTKLVFVYDQSLKVLEGDVPQVNVLSALFTQIQHAQNSLGKYFPKLLLLSKSDRIYATDLATVERNGYEARSYAIEKIPSFAQSFFNEDARNRTIFYKMGTFSTNSDLLLSFDKECPEKLVNWLYQVSTGNTTIRQPGYWDRFKSWFTGRT